MDWTEGEGPEASEEDMADLIRLDGSAAQTADFESETGDDNWPEDGAEAALLTLVARREPSAKDAGAAVLKSDEGATDEGATDEGATDNDVTGEAEPEVALDVSEADDVAEAEITPDAEDVSDKPAGDTQAEENTAEVEDDARHDGGHDAEDNGGHDAEDDAEDNGGHDAEDGGPESDGPEDNVDGEPIDGHGEAEAADGESAATEKTTAVPIFARQVPDDHATDETTDGPVEDLGDTRQPFSFPEPEDGILDEDTLREIIVDVVREELQGVLGQRITRNVRKMVRREVRLAMAAEDLE